MRTLSTLAGVIAVAGALAARPALADIHHHTFGGDGGDSCDGCLIGTGVVAGAFDVTFLAVGIPLLATGSGFGPGWSIVEMLWGAAHGLVGLILTPFGALGVAFGTTDGGTILGSGLLLIIIAAWLISHGIISLKRYFAQFRPAEHKREQEQPEQLKPPGEPPPPPPGEEQFEQPFPTRDEQTLLERLLPQLTTSIGPRGASVGLGWSF